MEKTTEDEEQERKKTYIIERKFGLKGLSNFWDDHVSFVTLTLRDSDSEHFTECSGCGSGAGTSSSIDRTAISVVLFEVSAIRITSGNVVDLLVGVVGLIPFKAFRKMKRKRK